MTQYTSLVEFREKYLSEQYLRARMMEPDWKGGAKPLQDEIRRLRAILAHSDRSTDA